MQERRKYPRFDIVAKIHFKKLKDDSNTHEAFVKDISAEGFCFSSSEELSVGENLEVEIVEQNSDNEPIIIKGQVMWCYKPSDAKEEKDKNAFIAGVKVLGIRSTDEARFAMLYCERMLAELKSFLRM